MILLQPGDLRYRLTSERYLRDPDLDGIIPRGGGIKVAAMGPWRYEEPLDVSPSDS